MNLIFGFLFLALSAWFADEKAAYQAAHDFCPDTFVQRIDDRSHFDCEGVAYVAICDDGVCTIEAWEEEPDAIALSAERSPGRGP